MTTAYAHIEIDPDGVPRIAGTGVKVIVLAEEHIACAWDAEQLLRQHEGLTLGQIHSALAYYYDHQGALDQQIRERVRLVDEMAARRADSPLRAQLRAAGLTRSV